MIEVSHLSKHYGDKRAVDDISFTINEGEIVGFLGPNGAGKTTTMNIITGYISATAGSAKIDGIDVLEDPMAAKKKIGYLPEMPPLYMDMTVDEYLNFAYDLKKIDMSDKKAHIAAVCDMVKISHVRKRVIKNLSKGYKQRVGMAQALLGNPDVLILDEPTVGLDPTQIIEIRNVIKDLGKRCTIIFSSHILPEVSAVCERVLVINEGKLIADDTPEALSAIVANERKLIVRIAGNRNTAFSILRGLAGIRRVEVSGEHEKGSCDFIVESQPSVDIRKPMFSALAAEGQAILMLKPLDVSLEDIFLKLVGASYKDKGDVK